MSASRPGTAAATAFTVLLGGSGVGFGTAALFHHFAPVHIGWLLPMVGVDLRLDPLGGFFLLVIGAVAMPVGVYAAGYVGRHPTPRFTIIVLPIFVAAMLLVPSAGSVTTFLLAWELMALTSLLLVLSEYHRDEVRIAGLAYAALTQLGFIAILLALMVLSTSAGSDVFAHITRVPSGTRAVVLILTLVGFGSKAGLVPLHAWLPRAHPEAPSFVSALMSGAMVNLGVYGILRFDLQLFGPAPRWFGLVMLIVGAVSALYGVLQASVATDLKRLLAYSTTENMGLIMIALGVSALLASAGLSTLATLATVAALVHVIGHAAFKTLGFLAAGAIFAGTGLRDLDEMGGLARRMPATTALFGIAAIGACGLPLGAGFVSEWLLVQSLIHTPRNGNTLLALAMPLAVGVVALSTGLAVAAMVKAFGIGFLARARSKAAEQAHEASNAMLVGMGMVAAGCAVVAVAPIMFGSALRRVLEDLPSNGRVAPPRLDATLRLPGIPGSVAPGWLALAIAVATVFAVALTRWGARHRPAPISALLWACGADGLTPRMQYTASSFAEPLQRVFDDVLRPDTDIEVSHAVESRYLVEKVRYRARVGDVFEDRLYAPIVAAVEMCAGWVRQAHSGSVHRYLAFGGLGLLVVLVVAR